MDEIEEELNQYEDGEISSDGSEQPRDDVLDEYKNHYDPLRIDQRDIDDPYHENDDYYDDHYQSSRIRVYDDSKFIKPPRSGESLNIGNRTSTRD